MTNLKLLINNTTSDTIITNVGTDWIEVDDTLDYFIFTAGGSGVANGNTIPSVTLLNRYAVQLDDTNIVVVPKYLLADYSSGILKEAKLAGNQNKRYAFGVRFDGATASEPVLEAWDDTNMTTVVSAALGSGTPNLSWYKAFCTTAGLPGVDWPGIPLAGAGISNIVLLNNGAGALTGATDLYFNFKVVIPGGYLTPSLQTPILTIVYTTN
jgi:hypothetical protein